MTTFPVHTQSSAPEGSKALLQGLQASLGMVPNLAASMAESPELLEGFLQVRRIQHAGTFTPGEVQILSLTNAFENHCGYCMGLHSALALKAGVSRETVDALRRGASPVEPKQRALSDFSRRLAGRPGALRNEDLAAFLAAGYTRAQALEVVLGVAVSILPGLAHHITGCPLDEIFQPHAWNGAAS